MATKREVQRRARAGEVASYLRAQYVRMIIPNAEEGGYLAEVLELPGCVTDGETPEEAYRNLEEAMAGWLKASLDTKRPIPDPVGSREYSGHFPLRMSTELHRAAALRAMQEGVSLNHWIARSIAEKVAKEDLAEKLGDRITSEIVRRLSVDVSAAVRVRLGEATMSAPSPSDFIEAEVGRATTEDIVVTPEPVVLTTERALWRAVNARQAGVEVNQDA